MAYVSTAYPPATASSPTACFVWKTEKPSRDVSRKSCDFSLLGAVWWLEVKYSYKNSEYYFTVTLKKKTGSASGVNHIDITTILEIYTNYYTKAKVVSYYNNQSQVQSQSETIIWEESQNCISSILSNFSIYGAWKIICIFHDIPPPVLKIDDAKVDSSTQVDEGPSPTADQCTQVSIRDFSDLETLSEDFSNLLRLSLHPDAILRCSDRTFPVHRSVLAARSPVFDTVFQNAADTFDVTDLDVETLGMLLEYAYSGTVRELTDAKAVGLHGAGRKYGMDSLRKACSDWMVEHLTEDNCVSFLGAASSSDDGPLEEAVATFICDHPEVFGGSSWDGFAEEHQSLAYRLMHTYTLRTLKKL